MTEVKATLETFKVIRDSAFAVSVSYIVSKTGFDKRRVQRQAKTLTESKLIQRIGENPVQGYVYKVTPINAG